MPDSDNHTEQPTDAIGSNAAPSAEMSSKASHNRAPHSVMDPYGDLGSTPELAGYSRSGDEDSSAASAAEPSRRGVSSSQTCVLDCPPFATAEPS